MWALHEKRITMPRGVPKQPRTVDPTPVGATSDSQAVVADDQKLAVQSEPRFKNYTPRDLPKDYDGTLYVRNETDTFVSFDDGKGNVMKLRQAGTPDSIRDLPPSVARNPGFQRFWRQGKVTVSDDPDLEIQLEKFAFDDAERARTDQFALQQKIYNPRTQELEWPGIGDVSNNLDE